MEEQYGGMPDLHHYIDGRPLFPAISHPPELMPSQYPYDMLVFRSDTGVAAPSDGGGAGRWPRQETLTLLEIRSKLDPKFKEANQKGPLWDEVSRILWQEHGYQRSGKKCREKFENLYKYYKKTKEGKAGRQDGKHYRFFRQLEALYGAADDHQTKVSDASFPDSCDAASSYCSESNAFAADDEDYSRMMRKKGKRSMKAEIEASVEAQMKEMMEKQEAWMERMTTVIEGKEAERLRREEQWRRQDAARIDGEQKMWASERAWVESRDAALMEAFHRLAGKQLQQPLPPPPPQQQQQTPVWPELMQLRSGMELRFGENGMMPSEESAWDEISAKMAAASTAGGGGSGGREKLDQTISDYLIKCSKKRRENAKASTYGYHQNRVSIPDHGVAGGEGVTRMHGGETNRSSGDDGLFRYFIGDSCQRYYDLK